MNSPSDKRLPSVELGDVGLVVLAAGKSSRMGSPKAIVEHEGRPLIEHLLGPAIVRRFAEVVVVLGHDASLVGPVVDGLGYRHVLNSAPDRGRTGSVQVGLRALAAAVRAVFVQPVDCPIVSPQTYAALAAALGEGGVAVPTFQGRCGHPPLLSARLVPWILERPPDLPLRAILQSPETERRLIEVDDPGILLNVDRPEDLRRLASLPGFSRLGAFPAQEDR